MSDSPLGHRRWPEITAATVAVPVGSLEQHGPHLPLNTDTVIATAVAGRLPDVTVAPAIAYGSSGEHQEFAGTVSIGTAALELLLLEFGRSVCTWASKVVFVNGHGGNAAALAAAVVRLRYEGREAAWLPCSVPGADAHAGRTETSLMLHLAPGTVELATAEPGNVVPIGRLMPELRARGVRSVTPNGILGDPTGATADEGRVLFATMTAAAVAAFTDWRPGDSGILARP